MCCIARDPPHIRIVILFQEHISIIYYNTRDFSEVLSKAI